MCRDYPVYIALLFQTSISRQLDPLPPEPGLSDGIFTVSVYCLRLSGLPLSNAMEAWTSPLEAEISFDFKF